MNTHELLMKIKTMLERFGIPTAVITNEESLLSGYCLIDGESGPYGFVIKIRTDSIACYMVAPYGEEAIRKCDVFQRVAKINLNIVKGHFNVDAENKKLVFKYLITRTVLESEQDDERARGLVRELVLLPAAMIQKYRKQLVD